MAIIDQQERTLRRIRELQPIPPWAVKTLCVLGQPAVWLIIVSALLMQSGAFVHWNWMTVLIIMIPMLIFFALVQRLQRDVRPDERPLPEINNDHEIKRVVERLTRNERPILSGQREIIDAYVKAHRNEQ